MTGSLHCVVTRAPAVALAALELAGRSASSCSPPVTGEEAGRLSEVFFANVDDGGSHFVGNAASTADSTMRIEGEVDFVNSQGYALATEQRGRQGH